MFLWYLLIRNEHQLQIRILVYQIHMWNNSRRVLLIKPVLRWLRESLCQCRTSGHVSRSLSLSSIRLVWICSGSSTFRPQILLSNVWDKKKQRRFTYTTRTLNNVIQKALYTLRHLIKHRCVLYSATRYSSEINP